MRNLLRHVAIIMDGNGRWAESRGLPRVEGHIAGIETIKLITEYSLKKQIECISLFAFSTENWLRPREEVDSLMQLFLKALKENIEKLRKDGIKLYFTGDRTPLSPALKAQMQEIESITNDNSALILNIVINYGGKWDIVNAAKKLSLDVQSGNLDLDAITESVFSRYLNTVHLPEVDLLIRTGGEKRISNFFLWQVADSLLYFSDFHWPDFTVHAFEETLLFWSNNNNLSKLNEDSTNLFQINA